MYDNRHFFIYIYDKNGDVLFVFYRFNYLEDKIIGRKTFKTSTKSAESWLKLFNSGRYIRRNDLLSDSIR